MKKIDSYEEYEALIAPHINKRFQTNNFMTKDSIRDEISADTLYASEFEGGIYLFKKRDGYFRLSFYIEDEFFSSANTKATCVAFPENTVAEIARRAADSILESVSQYLQTLGFERLFGRKRLRRKAAPFSRDIKSHVAFASPNDADAIFEIMASSFHPLAGCLPTEHELSRDIAESHIVCAKSSDGEVMGILHFAETGSASTEIRHLAVREKYKRLGSASDMASFYISNTENKRSTVWAKEDNFPALAFYEKNGYSESGTISDVLIRK